MYVCIYIYIYIYIYMYMYICIYVYTYLLIHTYVQKETYKYEPAHIGGARLRPEREKTSRKLTLILGARQPCD